MNSKANYGIDAPLVVRNLTIAGLVLVPAGIALLSSSLSPAIRHYGPTFVSSGLGCLIGATVMLWGSKSGKLTLRDKIIGSIPWRGDEQVLDVGCGHGLMLIGAAKRLTTGRATGIDIWQTEDQAGNSAAATQANVDCEGVGDRVVLKKADARSMPFPNNTFDVVLSSWAIHNIYDKAGREQAIAEIIRVLKPEGRAVIADIRHGSEYAFSFRKGGMINLRRRLPNFLFVIPTVTIAAQKPKTKAT